MKLFKGLLFAALLASCNNVDSPLPNTKGKAALIADLDEITEYPFDKECPTCAPDGIDPTYAEIPKKYVKIVSCVIADVNGAAVGGRLLTVFGPEGTALGIVGGACIGSGWWYVSNNRVSHDVDSISTPYLDSTSNLIGSQHNQFMYGLSSEMRRVNWDTLTFDSICMKNLSNLFIKNGYSSSTSNEYAAHLKIDCSPSIKSWAKTTTDSSYLQYRDALFDGEPKEVDDYLTSLFDRIMWLGANGKTQYVESYIAVFKSNISTLGLSSQDEDNLTDYISILEGSYLLWSENL